MRRAIRAIQQNIFAMLPLFRQAAESSLILRWTIAATREAVPFARAVSGVKIRTCSPRLPRRLQAKSVDASRPLLQSGKFVAQGQVNRRCEAFQTAAARAGACFTRS